MPHYTPARLLENRVSISLIGCGGNGSQMLAGLARLNHAISALGHPGLQVTVYDPDIVSEANMGRQLFGAFDVGTSKANVLVHRTNAFYGLSWSAHFGKYHGRNDEDADLVIVCVDSAKARAQINRLVDGPSYLMDMGNRASDGQVILGERALREMPRAGTCLLPCPYEILPELIDETAKEDDTPSCGLAEALERQELFVNQSVVTPALSILWEFFRHGQLTWHGAFVNLKTGTMQPLRVTEARPPATPAPAKARQRARVPA